MNRTIRSLISCACLIATACMFAACSESSSESSPEPAADTTTPDDQAPDTSSM
jgi:hypothetical protein